MFLMTLSITLTDKYDITTDKVRLIVIGILLTKLSLYFVIENFLAYKYCKFIFTPWIIYILFLTNMMIDFKNEYKNEIYHNYFFQIFLVSFFIFLFILKLIKFFWSELFFYRKKYASNF